MKAQCLVMAILLFTIVGCAKKMKNNHCQNIMSKGALNQDGSINILNQPITYEKEGITISKMTSVSKGNQTYMIKIYLENMPNHMRQGHEFFLYVFPMLDKIDSLPPNRRKSGFEIWDTKIKNTDFSPKNDVILEMNVHSKLICYDIIAFGILNRHKYERIFLTKKENFYLK